MYILYVLVMGWVPEIQNELRTLEKNRENHCSTKWKTQTPEFGTLARPDNQTWDNPTHHHNILYLHICSIYYIVVWLKLGGNCCCCVEIWSGSPGFCCGFEQLKATQDYRIAFGYSTVLWSSPRTPNVTPDLRSLVSQECTCSSPHPTRRCTSIQAWAKK